MHLKQKAISTLTIVGIASLLLVPGVAISDDGKTYEVTITNLTPGQPFTPPVLLTHSDKTGIFTLGEEASSDIQAIAENGNSMPLESTLAGDRDVYDVVVGMAPIVPANVLAAGPDGVPFESSATFMITADKKAKFLSFASMLICTNDGFTGLDTIKLPKKELTVFSAAYDARTEMNTEDFADMVPPCQGLIGITTGDAGTGETNPDLAEDGIIIPHVGIIGGVDLLPDVHGWGVPVAKIEIERMKDGDD